MNQFRNLVFLACLMSCSSKRKQSEKVNINHILSDSVTKVYKDIDTARVIDLEYLDWNNLSINNKLPLLTSKRELINLFGSIDSIVNPNYDEICISYFDSGYKFLYFGASVFEIKDTMSLVNSIDFESDNAWILLFEGGKLIKFEYWMPC